MELTKIIWMFIIGAGVATVTVFYNNRFLGKLVRALLAIDATSPETAMDASELGLKITPALKRALRPGTSFSEIVIKTEDDRFYIAPDRVDLAKVKYRSKDVTVIFIILSIIILVVGGFALTYILPEVVERFSGTVTDVFGKEAMI